MNNKSKVMKKAWELAREAQAKFGSSVRSYFSECLKMAWSETKNTEVVEKTMEELFAENCKEWRVSRPRVDKVRQYFNNNENFDNFLKYFYEKFNGAKECLIAKNRLFKNNFRKNKNYFDVNSNTLFVEDADQAQFFRCFVRSEMGFNVKRA